MTKRICGQNIGKEKPMRHVERPDIPDTMPDHLPPAPHEPAAPVPSQPKAPVPA